jgi:hypothetical protein
MDDHVEHRGPVVTVAWVHALRCDPRLPAAPSERKGITGSREFHPWKRLHALPKLCLEGLPHTLLRVLGFGEWDIHRKDVGLVESLVHPVELVETLDEQPGSGKKKQRESHFGHDQRRAYALPAPGGPAASTPLERRHEVRT